MPIASVVESLNQCNKDIQDKDLELDVIFDRVYKKLLKNSGNENIVAKEVRDLFFAW